MTIYSTDFSEYTTGVDLSDWTDFWSAGGFTYEATANSGTLKVGTKLLLYDSTTSIRKALTWDDVASVNDSDIIIKFKNPTLGPSRLVRIHSRVGGSSGTEDSYYMEITTNNFSLAKYVNGTATVLDTIDARNEISGDEFWVRFQTRGTTIRAKVWSADAIEPAEWKVSATDSSLTTGYCGVGSFYSIDQFGVDYFSCGTSTDDAVFPPAGYSSNLLDSFGTVGRFDELTAAALQTRVMGGLFDTTGKQLTGITIPHNGFTGANIRAAVYSGGDLTTGPNLATLLYDFGEISATASPIIETCSSPVDIPVDEPIWLVLKMNADFDNFYGDADGNSGNYQITRGRADVGSSFGTDPTVAFPATAPDTNGTFGAFWYNWDINIETPTVEDPVIAPTSGEYPSTQLITITTGTSGATIYYTEDGSDPDATDTAYTVPFALTADKTIKAIGIKSGIADSGITTEVYTTEPEPGTEYSCSQGTWLLAPVTYYYQWTRDTIDIPGATSSTYTLVVADIGTDIGCTVTGENTFGSADADAVPVSIP